MEHKDKLMETAERFPNTDIWMDSCAEAEMDYAIERGGVGATSNPIIVGAVVKQEIEIWEGVIKTLIVEMKDASEEEIAWALIYKMGNERSKKLLDVYKKFKGKKGRLSIQTNAKYYRNAVKMTEQAKKLNSLGENMQIKIPASEAGIKAMEEATALGISINATVCFTVAQAVAVAEAVERGLERRRKDGLSVEEMSPICTIMIGRTDDWMKQYTKQENMVVAPECLEWAGIAVMKEAYRIFKERGYTTRLLSAAYRNYYHWSELVGGNLAMTIPYGWHKKLNACDVPVDCRIDIPVKQEYIDELMKISEFKRSFYEDGMEPEEFVKYGGFRSTIKTFIEGYDGLLALIRSYMI